MTTELQLRHATPDDHAPILAVLNDWWGGRDMRSLLPRLFFEHFQPTSFIIEHEQERVGFLIGFLSQTDPNEAYIHFVGVHPSFRKHGVARMLYEAFFAAVRQAGRGTVRCLTSPVNKTSIAFHTRMGFALEPGDSEIDGLPVHTNYDGQGGSRVLFALKL